MRLIFSMFLMKHNACIYQTDLISPVSEIKMVIWGLSRSLELFYQQYESFTKYYCSKTGSEMVTNSHFHANHH